MGVCLCWLDEEVLACNRDDIKKDLRGDDLGHLSCINYNITHGESSDEDRGGNDARDPGIMFPQFCLHNVMGNQFINLKGQRKENPHPHNKDPKKESKLPPHDEVNSRHRTS